MLHGKKVFLFTKVNISKVNVTVQKYAALNLDKNKVKKVLVEWLIPTQMNNFPLIDVKIILFSAVIPS